MVATAMAEPGDDDGGRDRCHEGEKFQGHIDCAQAKTADGSSQRRLNPAAHSTACSALPFAALGPAARHAVVVLAWPMRGSMPWRRLRHVRCALVSTL